MQYDWIPMWLSSARWGRYLKAAGNDSSKALALYEQNTELSNAIMHDIAHFEVAIRNVYDRSICKYFDGHEHWLFDESSPVIKPLYRSRKGSIIDLNARNRFSIMEAQRRARGKPLAPGQIIAELPFGFWRHLTDSAHEKNLWVSYLHSAFPPGTDRKAIEQALAMINKVRNRASHHEPLFTQRRYRELSAAHGFIIELAQMFLPELADHIHNTSRVADILSDFRSSNGLWPR